MTGLDPDRHVIVEIATLVTDDELQIVAEGPDLVVSRHRRAARRDGRFVREMHTKSGLLDGDPGVDADARATPATARSTSSAARPRTPEVPLCRNSIGTDRRFLADYLPDVEQLLPLPLRRRLDASRSSPAAGAPTSSPRTPAKQTTHRAMDDIKACVAELRVLPARRLPARTGRPAGHRDRGRGRERRPAERADDVGRSRKPAHRAGPALRDGRPSTSAACRARVWKHAPPVPAHRPRAVARGHGDKDFLVYEDERTTFDEHYRDRRHASPAGSATSSASRTATASPSPCGTCPSGSMAFWAVAVAGAVVVPLNAWWTGDELALRARRLRAAVVPRRRGARSTASGAALGPTAATCGRDRRSARTATGRTDASAGRSPGARVAFADARRRRRARRRPAGRRRSNPTTTRRSSTPRGRPAGRRARSARTATRART